MVDNCRSMADRLDSIAFVERTEMSYLLNPYMFHVHCRVHRIDVQSDCH